MNISSDEIMDIALDLEVTANNISNSLSSLAGFRNIIRSHNYWSSNAANYYINQLCKTISDDNIEKINNSLKQCHKYLENVVNNIELANYQIENGISIDLNFLK